MSMLLLLSIGCSNVAGTDWSGGGSRYASGYATEDTDTAGGDDTGSGPTEGAPVLVTGSAQYKKNEAEQIYIEAGIAYTDDPDDVLGGRLYITLLEDGESILEDTRGVVDADQDLSSEALVRDGTVTFLVGPVGAEANHALVLYLNDFTRNSSNEITVEVTGR